MSLFIVNYGKEMRMGADIRRKGKVEKVTEFVERMRRVQEKVGTALRKAQDVMRKQANRGRQEVKEWKKREKMMLSIKDLVFKKRPTKKLTERYVGPYETEKVVSRNVVKLKLLVSIRIHLVVNVSRVVRYRELVRKQRAEEPKPVEVKGVEEWEVKKILNKRKVWRVEKYLISWNKFIVEYNTYKRKEDLRNTRKVVEEFKGRMSAEVRRQEKLDMMEEKDFRRGELPEKYTAKMLYR